MLKVGTECLVEKLITDRMKKKKTLTRARVAIKPIYGEAMAILNYHVVRQKRTIPLLNVLKKKIIS